MKLNSEKLANEIRKDALKMVHISHASHIASAFSVADVMAVLYADILRYDVKNPKWDERDRLVLSKGHAGSILYATLAEVGFYEKELLDTYDLNFSRFSGHISHKNVPGVEFSTGSLGHGVCVATGLALAAKLDNKSHRVFAIVGDGECNEGTVWETVMFAKQQKLNNFTVIVDANKMQAMGNTKDVIDISPLGDKFKTFGWNVIEIDGHNHKEIKDALLKKFDNENPTVVIANTVKGKGVSFMENNLLWHYRDPQGEFYDKALLELEEKENA